MSGNAHQGKDDAAGEQVGALPGAGFGAGQMECYHDVAPPHCPEPR